MRRASSILWLLLAISISSSAQRVITVSGCVQDTAGVRLSNASVTIQSDSNMLSALTNKECFFHFSLHKALKLKLSVTMKGYNSKTQEIAMTNGSSVVNLDPIVLYLSNKELDSIVVRHVRPVLLRG